MKVYSIYDNKALTWSQPFYATNKATALRTFSDAVNKGESQISEHPTDYVLYEIGSFDDQNGKIQGYDTVENLGMASDYVQHDEQLRAV